MFGKLCPKVLVEFGMERTALNKSSTKLPANHEQNLSDSFLCQACVIHDHTIPAALHANVTKPRPSTQWATKQHGILLEPSRFPLLERRRSECLHLYQQYLHLGSSFQCRLYTLAKVVVHCPM